MEVNLCRFLPFAYAIVRAWIVVGKLSRDCCDPIYRFHPTTFLCLYHVRTYNDICRYAPSFCVQWIKV